MATPLMFVQQMNLHQKEMRDKKDWQRKIEIAEFDAKKARAAMRKRIQEQYQY